MKQILSLAVGITLLISSYTLKADEGMWLPVLVEKLNIGQMTELGFRLTAEDVYSINRSCLKDAILQIRGCTASLISDQGLIITNHHCAYGSIQSHSTVEHDYLTDGFWAYSFEEELPSAPQTATFLIRAEDITDRIISLFNDQTTEAQRYEIVDSIKKTISEEVKTENATYRVSTTPLLDGNQYMLFVYQTFSDIRLVGAPPESIGKYGADTDNWMWPRHTGDFSLYRIYANKDNEPAAYSTDNVPYKAKKFLKVSIKGVQEGDYTMIMGYPGSTNRYLTSWGVKNIMENSNALRMYIRGVKQDIWKAAMDADNATRIQYSSKYAGSSNYWKYSIGQNQGLNRLNVVEKKQQIESDFEKWVNSTPENKEKYGTVLEQIKNTITKSEAFTKNLTILEETVIGGAEAFMFAYQTQKRLSELLQTEPDSTEKIIQARNNAIDIINKFYKDYQPQLDIEVIKAMLNIAVQSLDTAYHPEFFKTINKKYKGDITAYVQKELARSPIFNKEKYIQHIQTATLKNILKETVFTNGFELASILLDKYKEIKVIREKTAANQRLFLEGLMKTYPDKIFYPNANSTMRLTYGTVGGYNARDAVYYKHYTTIDGLMAKENPAEREFTVPQKLKDLYEAKDYGRYADKDGNLHVGFLSNNDITGGNSGSPIMNANGELIGCAFDGNWEAMSGDIAFENELQRTVSVDIRYVLFIIDKFAGAQNLINEMTIVAE